MEKGEMTELNSFSQLFTQPLTALNADCGSVWRSPAGSPRHIFRAHGRRICWAR